MVTSFGCGWSEAVICERWWAAENVTTRVSADGWPVLVVKPCAGTAETRHTAETPQRMVTWPPRACTVCVPAPPWQPAGSWVAAGRAGTGGVVLCRGAGVCDGTRCAGCDGRGDGPVTAGRGEGGAGAVARGVAAALPNDEGRARAVGGSGVVECTTKRTVTKTAVTATAVQASQTRR